jgi:addiction module HigA family antidote
MPDTNPQNPTHPGPHIRSHVLPKGLALGKAAELLGVGRPALSNLLNGNAALTPEMALRLEKAFGADAQELLAMQAAYDEAAGREQAKEIAVRTYVPSFLGIEARQISGWAEQIKARAELPALLRHLVHATGTAVTTVDFPAFDNAQRPGWDGTVVTDTATPWIPRGTSGWEFGCNKDPERKANDDYTARTASVPAAERANTTFVFVTPHNWKGKQAWTNAKRASSEWKDVRALDASDLEQWLEQSVATQAWFAERLGNGAPGIITLETAWNDWANATKPPLSKILFRSAVAGSKDRFLAWLKNPPATPFVITADSEGEAVAFVSCALDALEGDARQIADRALVLQTPDALKRVTAIVPDFVAIVASPETEAASAGMQSTHHIVIARRRNDLEREPDLALDLVDDQTFREAILDMGLPERDYDRYARESASSPTILRRRLSDIPAIHNPAWSADAALARDLIPMNFVGVWDSEAKADQEILRLLSGHEFADVERAIAKLRVIPDAPVWSIGKYRGVMSKIDVLFATRAYVTAKELDDFFFAAEIVLSESDPALELPVDKQWAANIYGKTREHSAGLRRGLCDTLVLLAVHGDALFRDRLGVNLSSRVGALIRKLLLPLKAETWASQKNDLRRYAEAAPDVFLDILEQDLKTPNPQVHALLAPADTMFGGCPRSDLLWALESLAWKPERLLRVSLVLAELAQVEIKDNWSNKPAGSLASIYRNWMPQTAASIDQRNAAMEEVCRRYPDVGWRLIIEQFGHHHAVGHYAARPHWRNEAAGAGQTAKTYGEIWAVADKARAIALDWPHHTTSTLGDLVERLEFMPEEDQNRVWALVAEWSAKQNDDTARHTLRERIRKAAFTRRARIRGVKPAIKDRAREAYAALEPKDLIVRHLWLFAAHWVDESSDELEDEDLDFRKREARITAQRKAALTEIWQARGYEGLMGLCERGSAESTIGWLLAEILDADDRAIVLDRLAAQSAPPSAVKIDNVISGLLGGVGAEARTSLLTGLLTGYAKAGSGDKAIRLLKCAPFRKATWDLLELVPDDWRARYWRETYVRWEDQDESEFSTLIDKLLEADRPRAAFVTAHMSFGKIDTQRLVRLLRQTATSTAEPVEYMQLASYDVAEAFKVLAARPDLPKMELVQLEFTYAAALDHTDYGLRGLEAAVAEDPQLLMQLIGMVYVRQDGKDDPPEWNIGDEERRRAAVVSAYDILRRISRTPGTKADGSLDADKLRSWLNTMRALGEQFGRLKMVDHVIGEILGRSQGGADGVWPSEPVRQVFDAIASQDMAEGMYMGRHNARGAHFRSRDGADEHVLAAQYRAWASAVAFHHPFTAKFLEEMARSYDHEAQWHDTDANVRKRLSY